MSKKVLVTATNYSQLCADSKNLLESKGFEIIENTFGRPFTFEEQKRYGKEACAVICGNDHWDAKVFDEMPNLKVLCRFGVGYDAVNLNDAKKRGIYVTNAPGLNSNAVADLAIGLMFDLLRNITQLNNSTKHGGWDRFVGHEIKGMTIGLLGFGSIAKHLAKKLLGFEVHIVAYDKYPNFDTAKKLNVSMLSSVEEVLKVSDIVSVHLPNLPETRHTMNDHTFSLMKDHSFLVNTSRGPLVDSMALCRALTSGKLAAAAIDVYEEEPVAKNSPLLSIPNLITTPHTAAETFEVYTSIGLHTAQAVIDTFEGKIPQNCLTL